MAQSHYQVVLQMDSTVEDRLSMFAETGVADPVGGGLDTYQQCAREIEEQVARLLKHWD